MKQYFSLSHSLTLSLALSLTCIHKPHRSWWPTWIRTSCHADLWYDYQLEECIAWNFCISIFSPPLPMMPVVHCFCFVFYLFRSRSRMFFALSPFPFGCPAFLTESYGVNCGNSPHWKSECIAWSVCICINFLSSSSHDACGSLFLFRVLLI